MVLSPSSSPNVESDRAIVVNLRVEKKTRKRNARLWQLTHELCFYALSVVERTERSGECEILLVLGHQWFNKTCGDMSGLIGFRRGEAAGEYQRWWVGTSENLETRWLDVCTRDPIECLSRPPTLRMPEWWIPWAWKEDETLTNLLRLRWF